MDKHVEIVPIAAATVDATSTIPLPFAFGEDGSFILGAMSTFTGRPESFKPVFPLKDNMEVHRSQLGYPEHIHIAVDISLDRTRVLKGGEPVVELLQQLAIFVERVIDIAERRLS